MGGCVSSAAGSVEPTSDGLPGDDTSQLHRNNRSKHSAAMVRHKSKAGCSPQGSQLGSDPDSRESSPKIKSEVHNSTLSVHMPVSSPESNRLAPIQSSDGQSRTSFDQGIDAWQGCEADSPRIFSNAGRLLASMRGSSASNGSSLPPLVQHPFPQPSVDNTGDGGNQWRVQHNLMTRELPEEAPRQPRQSVDFDESYTGPDSTAVLSRIIGISQTVPQHPSMDLIPGVQQQQQQTAQQPQAEEIIDYARHLGMDLANDSDLLWIAEQGLQAPLPPNWSMYNDSSSGCDYYVNNITGVTTWEHPLHEHFRALYAQMSQEREHTRLATKLQAIRQEEYAKEQMRRMALERRSNEIRESFASESQFSASQFDDTYTTFDESFGNSKTNDDLNMTRSTRFSDTYDSLDMSLSTSKVGGLNLNLLGMTRRKGPKEKRGGGLGLEMRVHGMSPHNRDRKQHDKDAALDQAKGRKKAANVAGRGVRVH
mmetsp:Transcript_10483/g.29825  ORF Transcript_10483/g.29825 Transcript_10483/m.29825 type:complete len:481 (+) Transcript_10483:555-1997(+)